MAASKYNRCMMKGSFIDATDENISIQKQKKWRQVVERRLVGLCRL